MLGAVLQTGMDKNQAGLSLSLQCPGAILICLLPGLAQALLSMYSNSAKVTAFPCNSVLVLQVNPLTSPAPSTAFYSCLKEKMKLSTSLNDFNFMSSICMLQNSICYCFVVVPITCQRHFCLLWFSLLSVFLHNIQASKEMLAVLIPVTPVKEILQLVWKHHASTGWDGEHSRIFLSSGHSMVW